MLLGRGRDLCTKPALLAAAGGKPSELSALAGSIRVCGQGKRPGRSERPERGPQLTSPSDRRRSCLLRIRDLQIALGEFLDVHILERDNPHILYKSRRTIHVPDPGILHGDLEENLAVLGLPDVELDLVR